MDYLSSEEIDEFKVVFENFERECNGLINKNEIKAVLSSLNHSPTDLDLDNMIQNVDKDGNGKLDFEQFLLFMTRKLQSDYKNVDDLNEAFQIFDIDCSGMIDAVEFKKSLLETGQKLRPEECEKFFESVNVYENGKFSYKQITEMLMYK